MRGQTIVSAVLIAAVVSMSSCSRSDPATLKRLTKNLSSGDAHTRSETAMLLARFGPDGASAVPKLIPLLKDPNGGVRSSAAYALRSIGTPAAIKALDSY